MAEKSASDECQLLPTLFKCNADLPTHLQQRYPQKVCK